MVFASFSLSDLVLSWGKTYQVSDSLREAYLDDVGVYVEPAPFWREDFGVLAPLTNEMLSRTIASIDSGVYTQEDLFCATESNYKIGTLISDNLRTYKVMERTDHSSFSDTNIFVYKLKYQGNMENSSETTGRQEF